MTAHAAIAAVPKAGTPNRTLLQALLVSRIAYIIGDAEDPEAFDPRGEDGSPVTLVLGYRGQFFWFNKNSVAGHDGTTVIVTSATGGRYLVNNIDLLITTAISKTLTTPPDPDDVDEEARPSNGDAYIVPTASTGAWATWTGSLAVWVEARREWFRILPKAGWFVSVPGATRDTVYRYDSVQSDWIVGDGSMAEANSVPLSALIGAGASAVVKVQNQTTYAPPGSRKTGATPACPLGGTASNINDNDDTTLATTSALGDLSAAAFADRIVGQLTLAATTDLICIEVRGAKGAAASSASGMGLWYKSAGVWSQAGAGFTLSTSAQDVKRTGTFAAVTDIALVTEAKNWSTNTNTLAGLNAYDATVTGSVGDAYIVGTGGFGIFAGNDGKVAICETADTYTFYTPDLGDEAYDISLETKYLWNGLTWELAAGTMLYRDFVDTPGALTDNSGGSGNYTYSTTAPTTAQSQFVDADNPLVRAVKSSNNKLLFTWQGLLTVGIGSNGPYQSSVAIVVALFRDSEVNAIAWFPVFVPPASLTAATSILIPASVQLSVSPSDTVSHSYRVGVMWVDSGAGVSTTVTAIQNRLFQIEEFGA